MQDDTKLREHLDQLNTILLVRLMIRILSLLNRVTQLILKVSFLMREVKYENKTLTQ